jgi:hypothetical protein
MPPNYPNLTYPTWTEPVGGVGGDTYSASILNLIQQDIVALVADAQLGWLKSKVAWTYVDATHFTCPGDYTLVFHKGTKLFWTQTTGKYAYVVSSSYSAGTGLTTVTIVGNAITNAAVVTPYYSYGARPQGFPDWFVHTAVTTGFTSDPPTNVSVFRLDGLEATLVYFQSAVGASDATDFTVNLPIPAATRAGCGWTGALGRTYDNSAEAAAGSWEILSAGTVATLYKSAHAVWTAANNKQAQFVARYEI